MSRGVIGLFWLPITLTGFCFEAFGRATLELERIAEETLERAVRERLFPSPPEAVPLPLADDLAPIPPTPDPFAQPSFTGRPELPDPLRQPQPKPEPGLEPLSEDKNMADTDLNDDMVKLVQYAIVYTKRREERILTEAVDKKGELGRPLLYLETDRMTGDGFSNARIADWVRSHKEEADELDLESLRVYYDVVARWPRSSLKFEEERLDQEDEKIDLLRSIANK